MNVEHESVSLAARRRAAERRQRRDRQLLAAEREAAVARRAPTRRRRPTPLRPLGAQLGAYQAMIREVAANVGLYGSTSEIQRQAALAIAAADRHLGPLGKLMDRQATLASALLDDPAATGLLSNINKAEATLQGIRRHWDWVDLARSRALHG